MDTYLLVGLGNPGKKYVDTRHNLGFIMLDLVAEKFAGSGQYTVEKKFQAEIFKHQNLVFMKPLTYMNLSGDAVSSYMNFFQIPLQNLIVFHDDLDLEPNQMKMKFDGGSAGQKGITDIMLKLNTDKFARIRLGIGRPPDPRFQISDFVLSKLSSVEMDDWIKATDTIVDALKEYFKGDSKKAQSLINSFKV